LMPFIRAMSVGETAAEANIGHHHR
jgi:hypothetical protein